MKKLFLTLAVVGLVFTACKNNGGNKPKEPQDVTVTATAIKEATAVKTVKAIAEYGIDKKVTIASAEFANEGFKIILPGTPTDLSALELFKTDLEEGLTISNPNAKGMDVEFYAYDADGKKIGDILNVSETETTTTVIGYVYSDSATKITGQYKKNVESEEGEDPVEVTTTYNLNLVKGWNRVLTIVDSEKNTETVTSPVPAGTVLSWIYEPDEA